MRQKQKTAWQLCFSKGILDNSKGPFLNTRNPGMSVAEKTLRVFIFMVGVIAASQFLNFLQDIYLKAETIPVIFSQNLVREQISQGYVGSYYPVVAPSDLLGPEDTPDNPDLLAGPARVLSARTYRSQTATVNKTPDYQAELVSQSNSQVKIMAGGALTFEVRFKNTGQSSWFNQGSHFVALNVTDPAGRHSAFQHPFWTEYYYRPSRLKEKEVKPGETGTFRFALAAPLQPGDYQENFGLVAEHLTWISGGHVSLPITVVSPPPAYQAQLITTSDCELTLEPGEIKSVQIDYKNLGKTTWKNTGPHFVALNVTDPVGRHSAFQHDSWTEYYYRPTRLDTAEVKPNQVGRFEFLVKAPLQPGDYQENLGLVAEGLTWISGGHLTLTIKVVAATVEQQPNEPEIRVGLFTADQPVKLTADLDYQAIDYQGQILIELPAAGLAEIGYSDGEYRLTAGDKTITTTHQIRFVGKDKSAVFELLNYENRPKWNSELNDNKFRGEIEFQLSEDSNQLWVINELPLEQYLRGVAEAANNDNPEYLKALVVAERSYAQYHLNTGTKHAREHFIVDAVSDQVYLGYNFELRASRITKYISETVGLMVTHDNEVVVTPYFSHSDGRTRAWEEVWSGGPYPWLKSVSDPASQGLAMLGHGVGLSALGARAMAEAGATSADILSYYYQGIKLVKKY